MRARTATQTMASSSPSTMRSKISRRSPPRSSSRHGFSALVFVPTRRLGSREGWQGANRSGAPADGLGDGSLAGEGRDRIWWAQSNPCRPDRSFPQASARMRLPDARTTFPQRSGSRWRASRRRTAVSHPRCWRRSDGIIAWGSERGWHYPSEGETGSKCLGSTCTTSAIAGIGRASWKADEVTCASARPCGRSNPRSSTASTERRCPRWLHLPARGGGCRPRAHGRS